ncbi:glycosyltransferase [Ruminococcus flavefaciens]|uniref:glycosyltransferase n=1 Tax=Ruminococcus flavefaciens TaxID=1265 RepID=UPI00048B5860|nr:glycosyltransferase [Ruminococcus flavefaciens]
MDNKEKIFISAVVYVHNYEQEIGSFLTKLITELESRFQNAEIILVDDASSDQSAEKIREVSRSSSSCSITILRMSSFHGLEMSVNAGNDLAIGDMIYEFDSIACDYPFELIFQAYQKMREGYDLVSVSPDKNRRYSSWLFYRLFARLTDIRMDTERFRIVSRRLINRVNDDNVLIPYRKVIYQTSGFQGARITFQPDLKQPQLDSAAGRFRSTLAMDSLILFTEFGYRFSMAMTVSMMLISLLMTVYSVIIYLAAEPVEGWTTTILFLSIAFFGMFGILTVIIRYLQLLINLVFKRKHYHFSSIEKLTK